MNLFDEPVQLLIPVIAGIIGWVTNVMAVKMMFKPTEFVGIKPYLGWQGIVPANAERLASTGLELVTTQLLRVPELFEDFDAAAFVAEHGEDIRNATRESFDELASEHIEGWDQMAPMNKQFIFTMVENDVKKLSAEVLTDAAENIEQLMNVSEIVVGSVRRNRELMGDIFLKVGSAEFKFIEWSGLYFGFLFGIVQLAFWLIYPANWVLPVFGFLVGYVTNWLALKMIFEPRQPKKVGPFTLHGLFHRRQKEIAVAFADINSAEIFSPENLFNELGKPESRKALMGMVGKRVQQLLTRYQSNPLVGSMITPELTAKLEATLLERVEAEMFKPGGIIFAFTNKSEEIREKLRDRMKEMDAEGFENVLRPAFKQDEWKLILAGAVLGLAAGIVQLVALFADLAN